LQIRDGPRPIPEHQPRLESFFFRVHTLLFKSGRLDLGERLLEQVCECGTTPKRKRVAQL